MRCCAPSSSVRPTSRTTPWCTSRRWRPWSPATSIYNGINPFLAASDPDGWRGWLESIAKVAELDPRIIVAGHKRPELPDDDITASLVATSAYIRDFITEVELAHGSRDLVERMQRRYPDYGNPSALILSAVTALKRSPTLTGRPSGDGADHLAEQLEAAHHRLVVAGDVTDHDVVEAHRLVVAEPVDDGVG